MRHPHRYLLWLWLLGAGMVHAQGDVQPPVITQLQQAQALIEGGKPEQAYALLEPLESKLAGDVRFDYLLGVSALNSGKASLAVFAFERVQATDPQYRDIGLWLSIAYYQSGDRERAKSGFESVLAQSQNAEPRAKAERYLASIKQEEAGASGLSLLGKVEVGVGHDSNITNNPSGYSGTPQLVGILPAPASNQGGMESILNLGVEARLPVAGEYAFLSVDDEKRTYSGNGIMNSEILAAKGGMKFARNGDTYELDAASRQFRQQGTLYTATGMINDYGISGLEGKGRLKLSAQDYFGFLAQYNQVRFSTNSLEDTNQIQLGAYYMRLFQTSGKPVLYLGYARILDQAVQRKTSFNPAYGDGMTDAGRVTDGATLYVQYSISTDVDIFSTGYVYFRRDTGAFARDPAVVFGRDETSYLSLGMNYRFRPKWTLRPLLARTSNRSNILLYAYNKTEGTVILRREFN